MRALLVLAELWVASEIILLLGPFHRDALLYAAAALVLCLGCVLTVVVTRPAPSVRESQVAMRLLPLQLAGIVATIAFTAWRGSEYALAVVILLVVLRVPLGAMGFGGFSRGSSRAAVLWLVPALLALAVVTFWLGVPMALAGRRLLLAFLTQGFSEEFLFRGALFGRLRPLMPGQWAAFAQAILFALWHLGRTGIALGGTDAIWVLVRLVPAYAVFGFAMALLVRRTGNIAVATLFHTAIAALFPLGSL